MQRTAEERATNLFTRTFGGAPAQGVRSPGRVNLIGDHTDYNEGFVLPIAIDRETHIAFRPRSDGLVRVVSEERALAEFDVGALVHGPPGWAEYVRGVAWALDVDPRIGWEGAIASDVPIGASLSSSASLELAAAVIFDSLSGGDLDPRRLAIAAQRAENEWVGMDCGIMDQLSVAAGRVNSALLIDCRDLETSLRPVPENVAFVVLDTGTRRELTSSAYNERRETCEGAAAALGVVALRDVSHEGLQASLETLDDVAARRVRHVVTENVRVLAAADALDRSDHGTLGELMDESHASLRDDFAVSTPALDAIVAAARDAPGCLGARMTGAGFGGCAVAVVESTALAAFTGSVVDRYRQAAGLEAQTYVCVAAPGASLVPSVR